MHNYNNIKTGRTTTCEQLVYLRIYKALFYTHSHRFELYYIFFVGVFYNFLTWLGSQQVDSLVLVPGRAQQHPLAALTAGDAVFLLDHQGLSRTLHSVYGHPVTCLDASQVLLAFGVKRSGWMEHDSGNRVGHM